MYALIGVLLISTVLTTYQVLTANSSTEELQPALRMDHYTDQFRQSLLALYQTRYERKLDNRLEIALQVRSDWSRQKATVIRERFNRLATVGEAIESVSTALTERSRLLILGKPGSGKTVLLLKLAIRLLQEKADQSEAFPVIFNLASWSSKYPKFEDWLESVLVSGYGLSKSFASALLKERRIVFLLDGLDELAPRDEEQVAAQQRADCLRSLNQALTRGRHVVICCRKDEYAQIRKTFGQQAPVSAIVTLLDFTPAQVKSALVDVAERTDPTGARDATAAKHLIALLRQKRGKILLSLLCTPYLLTTALEVFDRPILDELMMPAKPEQLQRQLLHAFVNLKLADTANPHGFKPQNVKRWLNWLAVILFFTNQTSFELSDIQTYQVRVKPNFATVNGLCMGLIFELCFLVAYGPKVWGIGFSGGFLLFGVASLLGLRRLIITEDIRTWRWLQIFQWGIWRKWLAFILIGSVVVGCIFRSLVQRLPDKSVSPNKAFIFGALLISATIFFKVAVHSARSVSFYSLLNSPYQRLRSGFITTIVQSAMFGVCVSWYVKYVFNLNRAFMVFGCLLIGISSVVTTPLGRHLVVRLCLSLEHRMPLRYATFLDYACEAGILENEGGHWRFRHQMVQYYFGTLPSYSERER